MDQWAITSLQLHVYLFEGGPGYRSNGVFLELVKLIHLRRELGHCHDLRFKLVLDNYLDIKLDLPETVRFLLLSRSSSFRELSPL